MSVHFLPFKPGSTISFPAKTYFFLEETRCIERKQEK